MKLFFKDPTNDTNYYGTFSYFHEFNEVLHLNNLTINVLGLSINSTSSIKMAMEQNLATTVVLLLTFRVANQITFTE